MSFLYRDESLPVTSGPKQTVKFSDCDSLFLSRVVLVARWLSGPGARMICEGSWV